MGNLAARQGRPYRRPRSKAGALRRPPPVARRTWKGVRNADPGRFHLAVADRRGGDAPATPPRPFFDGAQYLLLPQPTATSTKIARRISVGNARRMSLMPV